MAHETWSSGTRLEPRLQRGDEIVERSTRRKSGLAGATAGELTAAAGSIGRSRSAFHRAIAATNSAAPTARPIDQDRDGALDHRRFDCPFEMSGWRWCGGRPRDHHTIGGCYGLANTVPGKYPLMSATRWVSLDVKMHTRPPSPIWAATRFAVISR